MMGWSPLCYIPSFVKIGPPVLEKIFEGFLPYIGMAVTWSCDQHHVNKFSFPCTRKLSYKIWFRMAQWFLRKFGLNFCMYTTLGQGQVMTFFNFHLKKSVCIFGQNIDCGYKQPQKKNKKKNSKTVYIALLAY